jgi:hypothetical protein
MFVLIFIIKLKNLEDLMDVKWYQSKAFWTMVVEFVATFLTFGGQNGLFSAPVQLWVTFGWTALQPFVVFFMTKYLVDDITKLHYHFMTKYGLK